MSAGTAVPAPALGSAHRHFVLRWILFVTLGESTGFALAAAVAIGATAADLPDPVRYVLLIAGGAVEGILLGSSQVLAVPRPRPMGAAWVLATGAAAAIAWAIGMLPSLLSLDITQPLVAVLVPVGAVLILGSIPTAQWVALRRPLTARWIPVNMGAWAIAIVWTFAPSPIVDETTPIAVTVVLYVAAGLLMAATVAALTAHTAAMIFGTPKQTHRLTPAASQEK